MKRECVMCGKLHEGELLVCDDCLYEMEKQDYEFEVNWELFLESLGSNEDVARIPEEVFFDE